VTFVTNRREPTGAVRLNTATDLSNPETLTIRHQVTGSEKNGGVIVDRHLVSTSRVERDSAGVAHMCTVNLTIAVPRNGLFTTTEVTRQIALLANLLFTSGMVDNILQNQA
jgi:hypothetical protein